MALLFCDGFDRYGGANSNASTIATLITGEWTAGAAAASIGAGLSTSGYALTINGSATLLSKTLAGNYGRLIGGVRFLNPLTGLVGIELLDSGTVQASVQFNTAGTFSARNGAYSSGTILGTSTASVSANTTHYLEFDFTFANAGSYQLWLDGVSILSGSGDTTATANNYANMFRFQTGGASVNLIIDDLYLFDSTGSTNNAPLLNSPRIETTLPNSDSSVQFSIGAAVLGGTVARSSTNFATVANQFYLRPFTPVRNCTLNSISISVATTSATVNLRPIVYADSAGAPGTLLTSGSTVTGITAGATITLTLTTPQSLSAGTQYWLGYMADIAVTNAFNVIDATAAGRTATSTFSSGAPGTAPATTAGQSSTLLWGNVTSTGANYYEVNQQPPPAPLSSYLTDSTVGHQDMYGFPGLVSAPTTIHAVTLNAYCSRQDTGARTVSMRVNSGGTDSGGSLTGQTPAGSFGWLMTVFEQDPHTSAAWLPHNLDIATSGFKIDS